MFVCVGVLCVRGRVHVRVGVCVCHFNSHVRQWRRDVSQGASLSGLGSFTTATLLRSVLKWEFFVSKILEDVQFGE